MSNLTTRRRLLQTGAALALAPLSVVPAQAAAQPVTAPVKTQGTPEWGGPLRAAIEEALPVLVALRKEGCSRLEPWMLKEGWRDRAGEAMRLAKAQAEGQAVIDRLRSGLKTTDPASLRDVYRLTTLLRDRLTVENKPGLPCPLLFPWSDGKASIVGDWSAADARTSLPFLIGSWRCGLEQAGISQAAHINDERDVWAAYSHIHEVFNRAIADAYRRVFLELDLECFGSLPGRKEGHDV